MLPHEIQRIVCTPVDVAVVKPCVHELAAYHCHAEPGQYQPCDQDCDNKICLGSSYQRGAIESMRKVSFQVNSILPLSKNCIVRTAGTKTGDMNRSPISSTGIKQDIATSIVV